MADQGVYTPRALINLYNFKPLFGLSSSPTNLRFNLYVWFLIHHVVLVATSYTRDPPNPGVHTYQRLWYWSRVTWHGSTSADLQQPGETPQLFFFPWKLPVIVYIGWILKMIWKIWISMCFDFTINFSVPKFLGKAQALPTLGTTMGRAEISCCNCCFKRALVWHFWRSGGWLAIWIERLNIIKLESWSCSYGFIPLIRNLNNGFGFH